MLRSLVSLVLFAICIASLPAVASAQVGGPPSRTQSQSPRTPPPGPSAEDILRLLFPPESQADSDQSGGQFAPQPAYRPAPPALRIPSPAEVAGMTSHQQRAALRQALAHLDKELDALPTGSSWKGYLQTTGLGGALWYRPESEPQPDADTRDVLRAIAERFEEVQKQPAYRAVSSLQGFQLARAVLPEYATSPVEKSQRSLRTSVAVLADSLNRLTTGGSWKEHLQTDELTRLASQTKELQPSDNDILREIVERFDQAQRKPEYRQVTSSSGFASSREAVRRMIEAVRKEQEQSASRADKTASVVKARPNASHMERLVVSLLNDQKRLHDFCAEESRAKEALTVLTLKRDRPGAGDTLELVKETEKSEDVLRLIKQQHEEAARKADNDLLKLLKALQAGSTKKVGGQTVMLLPLDAPPPDDTEVVRLLQFTDKPEETEYMLLPLGTDPPKENKEEKQEEEEAEKSDSKK